MAAKQAVVGGSLSRSRSLWRALPLQFAGTRANQ
jgi:hypothetical protein